MNTNAVTAPQWVLPPHTAALIFDCDGTLADTMPIHYHAWTAMLGRYGIPFSEEKFYSLGGMPTARIIRLLADECGVVVSNVEAMVEEKEAAFLVQLETVQPVQPVFQIAEQYRGMLPMAVASGGYRNVVRQTLHRLGVVDWFGAIVCAEDTPRHKPEPDVFLEAARQLGVPEPARCVVFEDTDIGLEAARRAGMLGVDVRPWL
ncbi:MAG: HAD family phosphatase [Bacteroidales bacterium]|nr:HAD family phosphatase [Bacteroidales bacterium]